jgi:hypothetical protein
MPRWTAATPPPDRDAAETEAEGPFGGAKGRSAAAQQVFPGGFPGGSGPSGLLGLRCGALGGEDRRGQQAETSPEGETTAHGRQVVDGVWRSRLERQGTELQMGTNQRILPPPVPTLRGRSNSWPRDTMAQPTRGKKSWMGTLQAPSLKASPGENGRSVQPSHIQDRNQRLSGSR